MLHTWSEETKIFFEKFLELLMAYFNFTAVT